MRGLAFTLFSLAALMSIASDAWGQAAFVAGPGGGAVVQLEAIGDGLQATVAPLPNGDPNLPGIFPGNLKLNVGFVYLRPDFPGRSVTLTVPTGVNRNFSSLAGSGDVSYDFAFVPKFSADYQFNDLGFGVAASGVLTSLSGHLTRTIDSAAGTANLTADSTINLAVANLVEGSVPIPLNRFPCFQESYLEDTLVIATLGTRYSHLAQDYTASLVSGVNNSKLIAHQDWDGFGITMSLSFLHPLGGDFHLYGVSRGSFLLGTNNRNSDLSVLVSGDTAASTSTKLTENKTDFVPIGEFEVGVAWGKPLAPARAQALAATQSGPLLWVKVGLIADIWGDLGLLSPQNGVQGFSNSRLLLFGFSVMAGVQF